MPSVGLNQTGDTGLYQSGGPPSSFIAEVSQSDSGFPSLKVRGVRVAVVRLLSDVVGTSISDLLISGQGEFRQAWGALRQAHPLPPGQAFLDESHPLHSSIDSALRHGMWQQSRLKEPDRDRLWRGEVVSLVNGRRRFAAENGVLGMVPNEAREGDTICILLGAPIPLVLRPSASTVGHVLVGGCYVNGIMRADAISYLKERAEQGIAMPVLEEDFVLL